jgi:hypothetical protein
MKPAKTDTHLLEALERVDDIWLSEATTTELGTEEKDQQ